jgi:diguanylate cyclase (GGDEF)-like protein/PAS domain S-box-containing protein
MRRDWNRITRALKRFWIIADRKEDNAAESLLIMAERCGDVVFRYGFNGEARYISPSVERLLGTSAEEIYGLGREALFYGIHPTERAAIELALSQHAAGDLLDMKLEFRVLKRNDTYIWVQTNCSTIIAADGRPSEIILTMRDISEKKELEAKLESLACTDALTGLANRRAFDEALDLEWRRARRDGTALSLIMLDTDHFKAFNDAYGHPAGDDCLRAVARSIGQAARREGELAARYGGEEFALLMPLMGSEEAISLSEQIRREVEDLAIPHRHCLTRAVVTVSIGVATAMAADGASVKMPDSLLEAADRALYKAKAGGRNCVEPGLLLTSVPALKKAS